MKAPKRIGQAKRLRPGDPAKWGKLDDRLQAKLIAHIKEGLSYQTCCDLVGLSRATFYNWIARGESDPQSRHGAFARAIAKAGAQACRALHIAVQRSDPKWILERRFVNDYGPPKLRTEAELTGPGGGPLPMGNPFTVNITCDGPQVAFPILNESGKDDDLPPRGYRKEIDRHGAIWFIPISADAMADASWISNPKL
jgi:hypothetical protein